jgi:hypothetical protein
MIAMKKNNISKPRLRNSERKNNNEGYNQNGNRESSESLRKRREQHNRNK